MLLCGINDVQPGVTVVGSVMHPNRPETELVKPGLVLDANLLSRLKDFGVERVWIDHDATADLDLKIDLGKSKAHQEVYDRLKSSFRASARSTISTGDVLSYKQAIMDLVCELMANPALATLADRMTTANNGEMFRHGSNVAYLSVLIGLQMETYIVQQRSKLASEHARDLTALGIGAMLHDIGKLAEPSADARKLNAHSLHQILELIDGDSQKREAFEPMHKAYRNHCTIGYRLLEAANAPASARQVVLTHHQRWDGKGFPDMNDVTRGRQSGTQAGEKIHIFSRIVGAADLLDHLLQDAAAQGQPAIAALSAFRSEAFASWMDPVIRDAVLRTVPPFPVASHVTLSDGRCAVVIAPNAEQPCLPVVRILDAKTHAPAEPFALAEHREVMISHLLGEPIEQHIFLMPEQAPLARTLAKAG